jgi:hypothetical protein
MKKQLQQVQSELDGFTSDKEVCQQIELLGKALRIFRNDENAMKVAMKQANDPLFLEMKFYLDKQAKKAEARQ